MTHKCYYLIVFLFSALSGLNAQWLPSPAPPGDDIEHIFFYDNQTGYLHAHGDIFKTVNGGQTWTLVYKPGDINGFEVYFFRGLFFTSATTGFAIGQDFFNADYLIMRTENGGQSWSPYTYDVNLNVGECLSVDFSSPTNGFVAGNRGTFFKTGDGGNTWFPGSIAGALGQNLTSLDFVSALSGFALSDDQKLYKTLNGGQSWQTINLTQDLDKIQFFSAQDGLASGYNGLYKTTDGGLTWNHFGEIFSSGIHSMHFIDANTGFAFISGSIRKTVDGGQTWHVQQLETGLPPSVNAGFTGLFSVDGQTAWACGYRQENNNLVSLMAKTTNGGGLGVHLSLSDKTLNCPGETVTATPSFLGTPDAVSWYLEGALISTDPGPQTIGFPQTGQFDIRLEANAGSNAVAMERGVQVNGSFNYPGVTFSIPYQPCQGEKGKVNTNWNTNWGKMVIYKGSEFIDTAVIYISQTQGKYFEVPGVTENTVFTFKAVDMICHMDVELGSVTFVPKILPLTDFTLSTPQAVYCEIRQTLAITQSGSETGVGYKLYRENQQADSESGTGNTIVFNVNSTFDKPTRFWVVAYKSSSQCSATLKDTLLVPFDLTDAVFSLNGINQEVGQPVQVAFLGVPAVQYDWSFGNQADPATSNLANPGPVMYNGAVHTQIQLITTGPWGCMDTFVQGVALLEPGNQEEYWAMEMNFNNWEGGKFILVDSAGDVLLNMGSFNNSVPIPSTYGAGTVLKPEAAFLKYDKHGILQWQIQHVGEHLDLRDMVYDHEGNIVALFQAADFDQGDTYYLGSVNKRYPVYAEEKLLVAKWNRKGEFLWQAEVKTCSDGGILAYDLAIDNDNNVLALTKIHSLPIACNYTITFLSADSSMAQVSNFSNASFVTTFSPEGKYSSIFILQTPAGPLQNASKIDVDEENNLYVSAYTPTLLTKFSQQGDLLWTLVPDPLTPATSCNIKSIEMDDDGNFYIMGTFSNTLRFGQQEVTSTPTKVDVYIAKVNPLGQVLWLKAAIGNEFLEPGKMAVHDKDLYIGVDFKHLFNFQSLSLVMNNQLTSNRGSVWMNLSTINGGLKSYQALNLANPSNEFYSAYYASTYGIDTDLEGNLYLAGRNGYRAEWADTLLQSRLYMFLTRIAGFNSIVGTQEDEIFEHGMYATVSPNPSSQGTASVELHLQESSRVRGKLVDMQGREQLLFDKDLQEGKTVLMLETPPSGIYVLHFQMENGATRALKWVVTR